LSTENRASASRRRGIEADLAWQPSDAIRLSANYAFLKATQPDSATDSQLEEHRRPRHSGAIHADGSLGRWSYGASLAYVGSRLDREEVGPRAIVRLAPYLLASARVAFALTPALQLFVRGSNLLDDDYEDSAGYRTEGRGLFVGISLPEDRRSSP
jgi:vitamin B12 transporter